MQVLAFDVVHGDELDVFSTREVEDTNDVPVGDLAGKNQLLLEAPQTLRVGRHVGEDHFQGDFAIQFAVMSQVNGSHAPLSEEPDDFVAHSERGTRSKGDERGGWDDDIPNRHRPTCTVERVNYLTFPAKSNCSAGEKA